MKDPLQYGEYTLLTKKYLDQSIAKGEANFCSTKGKFLFSHIITSGIVGKRRNTQLSYFMAMSF